MASAKKDVDEDDEGARKRPENFVDAMEIMPMPESMDLDTAISETIAATNLFLNNKFNESRERFIPWADRSFYHALGLGTTLTLQAVMTFDSADMERASKAVKEALDICNKYRKRISMLSRGKKNYDKFTREEIHAEVCYAECLILRALLLFVQDENLISFVKAGLKIRACYFSYKECMQILEKRNWKPDDLKSHFESGVMLGAGMFNLGISLLPAKIMKLLDFFGFSGKKKKGLDMVEQGSRMETSLRGPLCSLAILGYHTVLVYVLGTADGNIPLAEKIITPLLKNFPKGALFLFFAGKIEEIKGNVNKGITRFEESVESQSEWRQFHHLNFWELMWCHSFKGDWLLAMKYAERLCKESKWSRATYTYQKAAFLMMCDDQTDETRAHVKYLLQEVPKLRIRLAGKSIPFEKFAMKKAARYLDQGDKLILPGYELIYVWNGFPMIGQNQKLMLPVLEHIEKELKVLEQNKADYPFYIDDYCLCMLLKGVALRWLDRFTEAEQCLLHVCSHDKQVKQDGYLMPYAMLELGLLNMAKEANDAANSFFDMAKKYHKYSLESRLHFRLHSAKTALKYKLGETDDDTSFGELSPAHSPSDVAGQMERELRIKELEKEADDERL